MTLAEQNAQDHADTRIALEDADTINEFALNQYNDDTIILQRIQVEPPATIDSAFRDKIAAEHILAQRMLFEVIPAYKGALNGWIAYISVLRSIEARHPGTIDPARLVIPKMPAELSDYANKNGVRLYQPF